jgi:hypothetical protein
MIERKGRKPLPADWRKKANGILNDLINKPTSKLEGCIFRDPVIPDDRIPGGHAAPTNYIPAWADAHRRKQNIQAQSQARTRAKKILESVGAEEAAVALLEAEKKARSNGGDFEGTWLRVLAYGVLLVPLLARRKKMEGPLIPSVTKCMETVWIRR